MGQRRKKQEQGMITVEAVLSLVPFILVILGISSFINIFLVHNKIQYSLQQMGNELSCYTYLLEVTGVRSADQTLQNDVKANTKELKNFLTEIEEMGDVIGSGTALVEDPQVLLSNLVFEVLGTAQGNVKEWIMGCITTQTLQRYLDQGMALSNPMTADQFLKNYGVVDGLDGLSFEGTEVFADESGKMIDIVVTYDLEIHFFKLFLKNPTITVVQRCAVPAWLDGDGIHYEE